VVGVSARSKLTHPGLTTTRRQAETTPRTITRYSGLSPPSKLGVFNGDINTLECALLERMYYCKVGEEFVSPPPVLESVVEVKLSGFSNRLRARLNRSTPVPLQDFVEMYKGPKRRLYSRAVDSLLDLPVRRRDATSVCFTKCEKTNVAKAPRVIQPRDPRYNAALGVYIKPLEHKLYRAIGEVLGNGPVVMKGYNLDQVGNIIASKWERFVSPIGIGLDATKFDMHVSEAMLRWEHSFYRHVYGGGRLSKLLEWQIENVGKGFADDGKLNYEVRGRRFSGDMNTALGNCLIMCAMVASYCEGRGIVFDLVNNGDDCVVFMEAGDEETFRDGLDSWFLELGFRMTVEATARSLERVEFCQMRPIAIDGGHRMVRDPRVAMEKDTMCCRRVHTASEYFEWQRGVARGGLVTCDGIPIMSSFYAALDTPGVVRDHMLEDSGMRRLSRRMVYKARPVSDDTRHSFFLAFGIPPDTQVAIEEELASVQLSGEGVDFVGRAWPLDDLFIIRDYLF